MNAMVAPRKASSETSLPALALGIAFVSALGQQVATPRLAVPLDPIAAILDAFRSHSIIAPDEGNHNNEQGHAFRLSLIRDPRVAGHGKCYRLVPRKLSGGPR
jgi:hypothetical protein